MVISGSGTHPNRYPSSSETFIIRSIFLDQTGQLSFERHSLANLSSLASAANIPFGMLRAVTGMMTTVAVGVFVEVEVADGVGGAIWLKKYLGGLGWLYACRNDSPDIMRSYVDAAGCMKEFLWLILGSG
jgi:hypothetical protein